MVQCPFATGGYNLVCSAFPQKLCAYQEYSGHRVFCAVRGDITHPPCPTCGERDFIGISPYGATFECFTCGSMWYIPSPAFEGFWSHYEQTRLNRKGD